MIAGQNHVSYSKWKISLGEISTLLPGIFSTFNADVAFDVIEKITPDPHSESRILNIVSLRQVLARLQTDRNLYNTGYRRSKKWG